MPVEVNEDVRRMVEEELRANPEASTEELKRKAEEIDSGIGKLSNRQFNTRYSLQAKWNLAAEEAWARDWGSRDVKVRAAGCGGTP